MPNTEGLRALRAQTRAVFKVNPVEARNAVSEGATSDRDFDRAELGIHILERSNFSPHFDIDMADEVLAIGGRIDPTGLFLVATMLNSPAMYAHTLTNADPAKVGALASALEAAGGIPFTLFSGQEQIDVMASGIASSNATFQNAALLAIGYNLALGTRVFKALRNPLGVFLPDSDPHDAVIIEIVTDFLERRGMTEPAAGPEDLYKRFVNAFTNTPEHPGVMSALLAHDKRAFKPIPGQEGCPGVSYASRTFDAFGEILQRPDARAIVLSILEPDNEALIEESASEPPQPSAPRQIRRAHDHPASKDNLPM